MLTEALIMNFIAIFVCLVQHCFKRIDKLTSEESSITFVGIGGKIVFTIAINKFLEQFRLDIENNRVVSCRHSFNIMILLHNTVAFLEVISVEDDKERRCDDYAANIES